MEVNLRAKASRIDKTWWRNAVSNEGIEFGMTISRKPWRYAMVAVPRQDDETRKIMLDNLERKRIIRDHNIRKLEAYRGGTVHLERLDGSKKQDVVSTPGEIANALFHFMIGRAQHGARVEWLKTVQFAPAVIKWVNDQKKAGAVAGLREKEGWQVIALDVWKE